jgi:hypothetical protein
LNVKLLIAEWGEGGRIERSARVQVCHDEENVIDDDAANRHTSPVLTRPRRRLKTRLIGSPAVGV